MINAYTIMMALVLLLGLLMHGDKKGNRKYILLSCAIMFVILGLRDVTLIGNDTRSTYLSNFHRMVDRSWESMLQSYAFDGNSCYYLFAKLFNVITNNNYQYYITITSALMMLVYAHFVQRYSVSPVQSFCYYWGLLLFLFMFSALKQAFAMTILLLAFDAVVDRKLLKFLFLTILASQFHFPALVFLPAYWIAMLRPGRYFIFLLAVLLLVTYLFRNQLLTLMMNAYEDDTGSEYTLSGRFFSTKVFIMLIIVIAAVILRRPTLENRTYNILLEFVSISIVFQTFCTYDNIFERLADYYFQFSVVLIPMIFERDIHSESILSNRLDVVVKTVAPYLFSAFGVWRYADIIQIDATHFLPFRFYF